MSRVRNGAGALALLAVSTVGGFEGLQENAYPDPATRGHPWTICYGSTEGVKKGDHKTFEECKALLLVELDKYADRLERCVTRDMPVKVEVAFLSLAYNIGWGGFCKSAVAELYNAGFDEGACDAILKFNRAAGIVMRGLTTRREKERAMCLQGVKEGA